MKNRNKGIGGSEVAAIMGLSEFSSPYQVWLEKTGKVKNTQENKYMTAGIILEDAVAKFFEQESRHRVIKSSKQESLQHPMYPYAYGHIDRRYFHREGGKGILECKTTQRKIEDIPPSWFAQLQWYLGISDTLFGSVAWLERGVDFSYKEYEYDQEFFDYIFTKVDQFWTENVQKGIPPEPICAEDVQMMYSRHVTGKVITADETIKRAYSRLKELQEQIKEATQDSEKLKELVKIAIKDAEGIVDNDRMLFTWKATKPVMKFDTEAFSQDNPELYQKYLKENEGVRRFLIK